MSFIYKITNDINNKVYVGKTNLSIQKRFEEHCRDSRKPAKQIRPLYTAMSKYGINHFSIEEIEECPTDLASEREQYWIGYFRGYEEGYNATRGGDGKQIFNHEEIAQILKENPYPKQVAEMIGCSADTVYIVAKEYHIKTQSQGQKNVNAKRVVHQYDKNTHEYIQSFDSVQLASVWLYENHIVKELSSGARSHISSAALGKRKSAYGYIWKY